jgi:hypothetical protein
MWKFVKVLVLVSALLLAGAAPSYAVSAGDIIKLCTGNSGPSSYCHGYISGALDAIILAQGLRTVVCLPEKRHLLYTEVTLSVVDDLRYQRQPKLLAREAVAAALIRNYPCERF